LIKRITKNKWAYIFLLPWFLLFSVFILLPFIIGFVISLYEYDFSSMKFILFGNYSSIFKDELFVKSILTTLKIAAIVVPLSIAFSLWVSNSVFNSSKLLQSFVKASFYIPTVVSSVALAITWKWIFNPAYGLCKYITDMLGVPPVDWYGVPLNAVLTISLLLVFVFVGQPIILYSAALGCIPVMYYEAADIDGASGARKFFKITLPLLKPTTLYIIVTMTIAALQIFEIPLLLTAGGPQYNTTTILYLLYKTAFEYTKFGLASSMGVVLFFIIAVIAFLQFKYLNMDVQY
jgi:multiple sugar transport system permease protein